MFEKSRGLQKFKISYFYQIQGRLNSVKVVGAQLTSKTHFYCEKLNSYEHLQILWGQVPPVPPGSAAYDQIYPVTTTVLNYIYN